MSRLDAKISSKWRSSINQLARIEEQVAKQNETIILREALKFKMKSINQLALTDPEFEPDVAKKEQFQKKKDANQGNKQAHPQDHFPPRYYNPEDCQFQVSTMKSKKLSQGESEFLFLKLQQSIILTEEDIKKKNQTSVEFEEFDYCYDCDGKVPQILNHKCVQPINSIAKINQRLKRVQMMAANLDSQKFSIIFFNSIHHKDEETLMATLKTVKAAKQMEISALQEIVRMRLINLLTKKIGFAMK